MRRGLLVFFLLALASLARPASVSAGGIEVVRQDVTNRFPSGITFSVALHADDEIITLRLQYVINDGPVRSYARPSFSAGPDVSAEYTLQTRQVYMTPGTVVTYRWLAETRGGVTLETSEQRVVYDDNRFPWKETQQGQIRFSWYSLDERRATELLSAAREALARIAEDPGLTYDRPVKIFIYDSRADMEPILAFRSPTFHREVTTLGVRFADDTLAILASQPDVEATLAHELMHMVTHLHGESIVNTLPGWVDEGLSMYVEGKLPPTNRSALEFAVRRDQLLSVRAMTAVTGNPRDVNLYYAEAYSLVKFLVDQHGKEKMVALLAAFKDGAYADQALTRVYGYGMDELDARWRRSLGLAPRRPADTTPAPAWPGLRLPTLPGLSVPAVAGAGAREALDLAPRLAIGLGAFELVGGLAVGAGALRARRRWRRA
jgi:hypothetical protein